PCPPPGRGGWPPRRTNRRRRTWPQALVPPPTPSPVRWTTSGSPRRSDPDLLAEGVGRERRRPVADPGDDGWHDARSLVDLGLGGGRPEAQAQCAGGLLLGVAHGRQDVRDLRRARRTGGSGRD